MSNIKRFEEYEYEPLSKDIENDELEISDTDDEADFSEFEIESIIDIIHPDENGEYGNEIDEAITTHLGADSKDYKRGDTIYITALIRKKNSTSFNSPAKNAVLKCRITDIFFGLQYLKKVIN